MRSVRNRGFSVIELLVSIAIILVLAALIVAVAGPIRRKSQEGICASHMSKIWNAMMVYRLNNGGSEGFAGDLARLGLPSWPVDIKTGRWLICDEQTWRCPAPKRTGSDRYVPQYEYVAGYNPSCGPNWYQQLVERYGTRAPLVADINHNDWGSVNLYAPRVKKRIAFIDLNGGLLQTFFWSAYASCDSNIFNLDSEK